MKNKRKYNQKTMKMKKLLFSFIAVLSMGIFAGCQEEIAENDLIEGKWVKKSALTDSTANDCERKSFIEFSRYVYDKKKCTFREVDSCSNTSNEGTYSISLDTLVMVDKYQTTRMYTIKKINAVNMILRDKNKEETVYQRYDLWDEVITGTETGTETEAEE